MALSEPLGVHDLSHPNSRLRAWFQLSSTQLGESVRPFGGYFSQAIGEDPHAISALADADDETASIEWWLRSYLQTNCAQCHQPNGSSRGDWDARITTPLDAARIISGILVNDEGDPLNRWMILGDAEHSMILKRLQGGGVLRVPPLATVERDLAA